MPLDYSYNLGRAYHQAVRRHASRPALRYPSGRTVTYGELNLLSNRIARALLEGGVERGAVVCIFNDKSIHALASMLACLKIGVIYANLDVSSPPERIGKMLGLCRPALLLYDRVDAALSAAFDGTTPALDLASSDFHRLIAAQDESDLDVVDRVTGADGAYIMFTSGSTGFPKGAVMSHANVLNFIQWARSTFDVTPNDVFTNVNPIYFDNSVFDFYTALFSGATLCPMASDVTDSPQQLVACVNRLQCTIWFSVPSMLVYLLTTKALDAEDFASVSRIIFGGEGFPKTKLRELFTLFGHRSRLFSVYGPTECTCICSSYPISDEDVADQSQLAPLGHIAPNFDYSIDSLDGADPDFGELLLSGPGVGHGYYNDDERTRASFIQDPQNGSYRRIMYRTGDLVRRDATGLLHFRGRVDNQIKHMGYRIELEEVEAAFNCLDYIDEVGVVYRSEPNGLGQIVAFVGSTGDVPTSRILADVRKVLPPYMVPKRITKLDALPKNRNGKIDRKALKEAVTGSSVDASSGRVS